MKQGWPCVDKFWSWVTRDSFYYSLHICIHLKFSMKWGNNEKPCMTFVEKITKDLKEELKIHFSWTERLHMISVQFSSVQSLSCVWLFATPWTAGHQASLSILEFTQTHAHWAGDAIKPSHPLLSLSPAFDLSQYQGLFKWVSSSHQVAKVLEFQLQHQSFQWVFRTDFL